MPLASDLGFTLICPAEMRWHNFEQDVGATPKRSGAALFRVRFLHVELHWLEASVGSPCGRGFLGLKLEYLCIRPATVSITH
jgi:hypothetical protein